MSNLSIQNTKLRTKEMFERYMNAPKPDGCFLCQEQKPLREYKYWYVIPNDFSYDNIASETHNMLVLKRHIGKRSELTHEEIQEFYQIVESEHDYETEMFNYPVAQSVPNHIHYHQIKLDRVVYERK